MVPIQYQGLLSNEVLHVWKPHNRQLLDILPFSFAKAYDSSLKSEFIWIFPLQLMIKNNHIPDSLETLSVRKSLPEFDIKSAVTLLFNGRQSRHDEVVIFIYKLCFLYRHNTTYFTMGLRIYSHSIVLGGFEEMS